MKDYLMLILADILMAANFSITKVYQKNQGVSLVKGLRFNMFIGLFTAIVFTFISKFNFEANSFSLIMAFLQAFCVAAYTILGFKVMQTEKISLYTMFLMTGGMVLPYLWGLAFLNEDFSVLRTIGLLVIVASIAITNMDSAKIRLKQILLCVGIFVLNGCTSIISKMHQITPMAVSTDMFVFWGGIMKVIFSFALISVLKKKTENKSQLQGKLPPLMIALIFLSSLSSGISYLLQLLGAKEIDATQLYPILTGGTIVLTAIAGRICFKEKFTLKSTIGTILCFIGTCMFL